MTRQILYQRYVGNQGTRTYDIRATMEFDEKRITDENAKHLYLEFLKDLINDPEPLIVVDKR